MIGFDTCACRDVPKDKKSLGLNSTSIQALAPLVQSLLVWYGRNARDLPWRRIENPYAIWVSEVMLQQTQVNTVIPFWERWMRQFPSVPILARAKEDHVLKCWEGLGYYSRARNLHRAAQIVVSEYKGILPRRLDEIIALPGIGRYTAGAICSIAFDQATPILDGNVTRVLARVFGIGTNPGKSATKRRFWRLADALVKQAAQSRKGKARVCANFNQALMELGATVCTPRQPRCDRCPIQDLCRAHREDRVAQLPKKTSQPASRPRHLVAFAILSKKRYLVRRRAPGTVNAHLWEFPNLEMDKAIPSIAQLAERSLGFSPCEIRRLCSIRHTITHDRIQLEVFAGTTDLPPALTSQSARWVTLKQLDQLAFPSAHRKIVKALEANTAQGNE